jgi:hypothetical protein
MAVYFLEVIKILHESLIFLTVCHFTPSSFIDLRPFDSKIILFHRFLRSFFNTWSWVLKNILFYDRLSLLHGHVPTTSIE